MRFRTVSWLGAGQATALGAMHGAPVEPAPVDGRGYIVSVTEEPCGYSTKRVSHEIEGGTVTFIGGEVVYG